MTDFDASTTLNEIREHSPCKDGWEKLLRHLGKTAADDEPLHLRVILDSNGIEDALWCLRTKSLDRLNRHFQAWCAEQVLHDYEAAYTGDTRVRDQIAMIRNDDATEEERAAALSAARAAALSAARDAARSTTRSTAWPAAWSASSDTASNAAWFAARAAARDAGLEDQEKQLRLMIGEMKC